MQLPLQNWVVVARDILISLFASECRRTRYLACQSLIQLLIVLGLPFMKETIQVFEVGERVIVDGLVHIE